MNRKMPIQLCYQSCRSRKDDIVHSLSYCVGAYMLNTLKKSGGDKGPPSPPKYVPATFPPPNYNPTRPARPSPDAPVTPGTARLAAAGPAVPTCLTRSGHPGSAWTPGPAVPTRPVRPFPTGPNTTRGPARLVRPGRPGPARMVRSCWPGPAILSRPASPGRPGPFVFLYLNQC